MKKLILGLILFFILFVPIYAQEPSKVYLPLIWKSDDMPTINEKWKVISPVESTNYVINPSAEITGNYSVLGLATVSRSTTYQKYGNYSYRVQTGSNGQGISLTLSTLPNENCFATARIRGIIPIGLRFIIGNSILTPILIEKVDQNWNLYGTMFPAASCSGRTELRIIQQGNGIGNFYVDGIQVENLEYWTSYVDGDQEGCSWNGLEHAATSTRSGRSYAGGQVKSLFQDYGFLVEKVLGAGAITRTNEIDDYAFLPGGEINEIKIGIRDWSLVGKFIADSPGEYDENRRDLLTLLKKNTLKQPVKFLYYSPRSIREIKAYYQSGLEGEQSVFYGDWITEDDDKWIQLNKYIEKVGIQLKSTDPYFYGQGNKSAALDANNSETFRTIAGRLKSTGQWSALGPPDVTGIYGTVYAIAEDATYVYVGGNFENWDNIAGADGIVRYNKSTGTWSAMAGGVGVNVQVLALTIGPDGSVYAGTFGGVVTNRVQKWDGSAWSNIGVFGVSDFVLTLAFGPDGTFYAGGEFGVNHIYRWDGFNWATFGGGVDDIVRSIVFGTDGLLYAGGEFVNAGGGAANRVATWDGSNWSALGTGTNDIIRTLAINPDGILYAGGNFTTAGGETVNYIAKWNGTSWSALSSGMSDVVYSLAIGNDNFLYVGGFFDTAGGITLTDRVARWNGYAWAHLDLDLPGLPIVHSILASKYVDPVIPQKYDLYLGFNTIGTGNFAGKINVNNEGSVDVFPKFTFERNGGTTITLETLKNESTGKELLFNYGILDGEKLTIDLRPSKKSIVSNYFGDRLDAILANSDFGTWMLETGDNDVTCFAADQFALYPSSLDAFVQWLEVYESYN